MAQVFLLNKEESTDLQCYPYVNNILMSLFLFCFTVQATDCSCYPGKYFIFTDSCYSRGIWALMAIKSVLITRRNYELLTFECGISSL